MTGCRAEFAIGFQLINIKWLILNEVTLMLGCLKFKNTGQPILLSEYFLHFRF
jgi:hypothetical protein